MDRNEKGMRRKEKRDRMKIGVSGKIPQDKET